MKTVARAMIDGPGELSVSISYPVSIEAVTPAAFRVIAADGTPAVVENVSIHHPHFAGEADQYATDFTLIMADPLDLNQSYIVAFVDYTPVSTVMGNLFGSESFARMFTFEGELGALYSKDKTTFRLWAPTALEARLNLYTTGHPDGAPAETLPMTKGAEGVWEADKTGDLHGTYYTYTVRVGDNENTAVDPYARAAGVNGKRGMVINLDATDPKGWDSDKAPDFHKPNDAVIYELHVRDFSISPNSGMTGKGKFLAFTETGTVNSGGLPTGVDHIAELGVTHVHLLPVFDFRTVDESEPDKNSYNWGYDPDNYNLPEGSYSTDPHNGAVRCGEFKRMVQSLHSNGLRVVMDVVYNHTGVTADSNLNLLVPNYYYRQTASGDFSNGSGCGNETASERSMVRKLIIDSVVYWAREYHVDGFRFDLMALHDIQTMTMVRAALDEIDPSILIYGEGWAGGGTPLDGGSQASKANTHKLGSRIAVFSDDMRDGIKGSVFNAEQPGYVNGNTARKEDIRFGIVGSVYHPQIDYHRVSNSRSAWAAAPSQTITYASSHDNLSLWDKLKATRPEASTEELLAMNKLAALLVFTSQGIPFFQAGEEMARTKFGDHNSYKSSDGVNQLQWDAKTEYNNLFRYYKGLIALRKAHPAFRFDTAELVANNIRFLDTDAPITAYILDGNAVGDKTFAVMVNTDTREREVILPQEGWTIWVNGDRAGTEALGVVTGNTVTLPPRSGSVLCKGIAAAPPPAKTVEISAPDNPGKGIAPKPNESKPWWPWAVVGAAVGFVGGLLFCYVRKRR